jgi:DNA gyrase subunit A
MLKAQASVGEAMKEFYVHGDAPCYGTFIRMGKPFALRYPLEEVQGNFGTLADPDNHSAPRYVEMRGSELCTELFTSINKDTVKEWRENYDQRTVFPLVFPSIGFYNIVNGAAGIATGISTSIPQFNIREVNNALITLLNNPEATFEQLYCPIDFATGATIINEEEVKESLRIGNGKSARIRAKIEYDDKKHQLIVSEMPYAVYTNTICEELDKLINTDLNTGIENFIDATNDDVCIKINLTKKANPSKVIDILYKNTSLQNHYSINMVMLDNGKTPRLFGWVDALQAHLTHIKAIKRYEFEFDLAKAKARLHVLEGYLIALANITEVVEVIKKASNSTIATTQLMDKFGFSEIQATAVLELKLVRLVNMEIIKIEKQKNDVISEIARIENILATPKLFNFELESEIARVSKKFGDPRRTTNINIVIGENNEPIEKKILVVYFSEKGAVQAQEADQYGLQMRGGKGSKIKLRDGDFIKETVYAENGSWVLVFTSTGRVHTFYLNDLAVGVETHIRTILDLEPDEEVINILPYNKAKDMDYIIIATTNGTVKKTEIGEFVMKNKKPVPAIKLRADDSIASVSFIRKDEELLLVSAFGNGIKIIESDVSPTGRNTMGVQGIKLDEGNTCILLVPLHNSTTEVCSITTNGKIKRTPITEISRTNRATKGVVIHKLEDVEQIASAVGISREKEILAVSTTNIIRLSLDQVPQSSRNTYGVSVMKNVEKITKLVLTNS